jgi:hypothetical protein
MPIPSFSLIVPGQQPCVNKKEKLMALYARSDMMSVSIPECGATHTRPVTHGAPAKVWKLECPVCEPILRGDHKQKVIKATPGDKDRGIASTLNKVPDADPHWSNTPEGVPLTPDEQHIHKLRAEQGRQQLDMLTAYAALSKIPGLDLTDFEQAKWLLDQTIDPLKRPVVKGTVVCSTGHENDAGAKFCGECGLPMNGKLAIEASDELPETTPLEDLIPLHSLHIATLRKRAREAGLNDKGTKAQLIERLST